MSFTDDLFDFIETIFEIVAVLVVIALVILALYVTLGQALPAVYAVPVTEFLAPYAGASAWFLTTVVINPVIWLGTTLVTVTSSIWFLAASGVTALISALGGGAESLTELAETGSPGAPDWIDLLGGLGGLGGLLYALTHPEDVANFLTTVVGSKGGLLLIGSVLLYFWIRRPPQPVIAPPSSAPTPAAAANWDAPSDRPFKALTTDVRDAKELAGELGLKSKPSGASTKGLTQPPATAGATTGGKESFREKLESKLKDLEIEDLKRAGDAVRSIFGSV